MACDLEGVYSTKKLSKGLPTHNTNHNQEARIRKVSSQSVKESSLQNLVVTYMFLSFYLYL